MSKDTEEKLHIALISLHGLIRGHDPELGRDADTGGQVKYVLDLARALGEQPQVARVDLLTRQIIDDRCGKEYSQLEEPLSEHARIVRIPFGPRRYLRKEALWPYVDLFVDQAIAFYRREGQGRLPSIIHGHYADAGYAGGQLARMLGIPFVFTGHSLGKVKQERLLKRDRDAGKLEETYRFASRIEAEEFALETASLVVASTAQEVEEQYVRYHHYVPERMEVIPPGIDLDVFRKVDEVADRDRVWDSLRPFLRDLEKPIILTIARPDDRKNLEMLVRVFGENPEIRNRANLVLVLGSREDLRELPAGQRKVLLNCLTLIDVYDLYGKAAYPKSHRGRDVPMFYQLAAESRGVFVNPALTEPFGLTLIEAAACGLPVVATNDGGPRDILANCENGLLADPYDPESLSHGISRVLNEPENWDRWSRNGWEGVRKHYSWDTHAQRYLRDVGEILRNFETPKLTIQKRNRRFPNFDRLVVTDIDNTLTGDDEAMHEFYRLMREQGDHVGLGIATGRSYGSVKELLDQYGLPLPEVMITSVGTEIYSGPQLTRDNSWRKHIDFYWEPEKVREVMDGIEGLTLQPEEQQSKYKISYEMDSSRVKVNRIRRIARENKLRVKVILSLGMFVDIIPTRAGTGLCVRNLAYKWGFSPEQILVAGDSGNDEEMLNGRMLGVVVHNYSQELEKLRDRPRIYFAGESHARGLLEGIRYYNFFDQITIPNDRSE